MRLLRNFLIPDMVDDAGATKFHVDMPQKRKSSWKRRLKWPGIIVAVLAVIIYVILPQIITPMIRSRLQKQISTQLNADLQMGSVYYWFPYGVSVSDAVLVAKDEQGQRVELLKIPKLRLALAKLPFDEGPLVIRKLILNRPAIHLIDTEQGIVGRRTLVKPDTQPTTQPAQSE